ncbi:MAG: hypothetical protein WCI71_17275, partial [Bacteroidota bacterium]
MMSISQFILAGAFILERLNLNKIKVFLHRPASHIFLFSLPFFISLLFTSIINGFKAFSKNKPALIFSSILLMHVVGLIFTNDFNYAFKDLRTKLPILLIPLYISSSQAFSRKSFYWFMLFFCASLLVRTLINSWSLYHDNYIDIRQISRSISHLRVALFVTLALFTLGYLIRKKRDFSFPMKIVFLFLILWFIIYLIITQSATGLMISALTLIIFLIILVFNTSYRWIKIVLS